METGLMNREKTLWIPKKPNCEGGQEFVSVGIGEIKPALHALFAGYGIAIAMFLGEVIFERFYQRMQKHRKKTTRRAGSLNENIYSDTKVKQTKQRITKYGLNMWKNVFCDLFP